LPERKIDGGKKQNRPIPNAILVGSEYHILVTKMTAVHGAVAPFNPDTDVWTEYIKHLQF